MVIAVRALQTQKDLEKRLMTPDRVVRLEDNGHLWTNREIRKCLKNAVRGLTWGDHDFMSLRPYSHETNIIL